MIWNKLKTGHTIPSIIKEILENYDMTEAEIRKIINPFINELRSAGLISK
ncbi:PqqD family protein [Hazenella sp. IB182357]|uniref:PqqD family protein n=1 Tax=Polycladospora coralii TaxID=2771432 RepID=A0A926NDI7_9BACL|nr:PqqD family protein [Polycladospora coralii]MBS7531193.1 PqqD family protein [Polycladospora coralii]